MAERASDPSKAGKYVKANGIQFHIQDTGGNGEAVVLCHGFPNDLQLFRHQVPELVKAGYRTVAIDLRGYGESDRPKDVSSYALDNLVRDVEGIMDALDIAEAHIVGHDWGALLAWAFAGMVPQRTKSLIAISVGHPGCFFAGPTGFQQRKLSWYMLLFQFKGVADKAIFTGGVVEPVEPPEAAKEDFGRMFQQLARPETDDQEAAATAGLNWYRANIKPQAFTTDALVEIPRVSCNTMMIYPSGDARFLTEHCPKQSGEFVDSPGTFRYERLESATHWPTWDTPQATTDLILSFLGEQQNKQGNH